MSKNNKVFFYSWDDFKSNKYIQLFGITGYLDLIEEYVEDNFGGKRRGILIYRPPGASLLVQTGEFHPFNSTDNENNTVEWMEVDGEEEGAVEIEFRDGRKVTIISSLNPSVYYLQMFDKEGRVKKELQSYKSAMVTLIKDKENGQLRLVFSLKEKEVISVRLPFDKFQDFLEDKYKPESLEIWLRDKDLYLYLKEGGVDRAFIGDESGKWLISTSGVTYIIDGYIESEYPPFRLLLLLQEKKLLLITVPTLSPVRVSSLFPSYLQVWTELERRKASIQNMI